MKTIYFVRHGESEANEQKIIAGTQLDTLLTNKGRLQAKETGRNLSQNEIELIVSSPLKRAAETAGIIATEIGYDPKMIVTNPLFIERGFGIYSKGSTDAYIQAFNKGALHGSVETVEAMEKRISEGLKWLAGQKAEHIVVVSHGDVSGVLRLIHQKLPLSQLYELVELGNAEIYKFTIE